MDEVWSERRGWAEMRREGELTFTPDEATLGRIARLLDVEAIEAFSATLTHGPWMDGVEIEGRVSAIAKRQCGVSLESFDERVDAPFSFRFVPEGSTHAPSPQRELVVDLEAEDPPEVVSGDTIELAAHMVETVALALDPFPRKPGAVFEYTDAKGPISPFAVLKVIQSDELD